MDWRKICAIDLLSKNSIVNLAHATLKCTPVERDFRAKARDGIQLNVRLRIALRTILGRYLGSVRDMDELLTRVCRATVATIGSVESLKSVIENPDSIAQKVLDLGLDTGTAFEILSVDIMHLDIQDGRGRLTKSVLSPGEEAQIIPYHADLRYTNAQQWAEGWLKVVVAGEIREFDIHLSFRYGMIKKAFRDYHRCIIDAIIKGGSRKDNHWARELFRYRAPVWEWDRSKGRMIMTDSGTLWDRMAEGERRAFVDELLQKRRGL